MHPGGEAGQVIVLHHADAATGRGGSLYRSIWGKIRRALSLVLAVERLQLGPFKVPSCEDLGCHPIIHLLSTRGSW